MRRKDAVTVGKVLGREVRFAAPGELQGLEAAIGAIRGHLTHVHPELDPAEYDDAVQAGIDGKF